ncbi:hypothetical protein MRY87_05010 [bacterium]|nr:hypothetical protein [bacterium]
MPKQDRRPLIVFSLIATLLLLASLSGCASRPSSMITATSPLPPGVRGTIPARGSDCQYNFLGLVPITSSASTARALDSAKRDADVDVLTDVTVDRNFGYYILFSNTCVRVEGMGVSRSRLQRSLQLSESTDPVL